MDIPELAKTDEATIAARLKADLEKGEAFGKGEVNQVVTLWDQYKAAVIIIAVAACLFGFCLAKIFKHV